MTERDMMYGGYYQINNKISNLENRVKLLEQKIGNSSNIYQDDNSLYMI